MKMKLMSVVLVMAMASVAVLTTSCESEDSEKDISPAKFSVDRDLKSYSDSDSYTWNTTNTIARVEHTIKDFHSGDASIQVYDGAGRLIFTKTYVTRDYTYYSGDNTFTDVGVTGVGVAGDWRITLSYQNFTGEQTVVLER